MRTFLCLASAFLFSCASSSAAVAPEPVSVQLEQPTEPAVAPSIPGPVVSDVPGHAEILELMEQLIVVAQAGDMDGLALLFHPALQAHIERELTRATEEKIAEVITCIEGALENGELYEGEVRSSLRQLGGRNVQLRISGAPTSTVAVEHEGQWYLVDTGC